MAMDIVALLQHVRAVGIHAELLIPSVCILPEGVARTFVRTLSIITGAVWTLGTVSGKVLSLRWVFLHHRAMRRGSRRNVGRLYECEAGN